MCIEMLKKEVLRYCQALRVEIQCIVFAACYIMTTIYRQGGTLPWHKPGINCHSPCQWGHWTTCSMWICVLWCEASSLTCKDSPSTGIGWKENVVKVEKNWLKLIPLLYTVDMLLHTHASTVCMFLTVS